MDSSFLNPVRAVGAAGIHEGSKVADFHASSGFFTRAAARAAGPRGVVWAVDAHADLLPRLKSIAEAEGIKNIEVLRGNIEKKGGVSLPDESVDTVLLVNALFTAEHKEQVVAEAARVLVRGGTALIIDWKDSFGGLGPHPSHVITLAEAAKVFAKEGFMHVKDIPCGGYHWGFLARKK